MHSSHIRVEFVTKKVLPSLLDLLLDPKMGPCATLIVSVATEVLSRYKKTLFTMVVKQENKLIVVSTAHKIVVLIKAIMESVLSVLIVLIT